MSANGDRQWPGNQEAVGSTWQRKKGCSGWWAGTEKVALVPPVPRPQDEVPRGKRLAGTFNQARSMGQTWDSLPSYKPCPHLLAEVCLTPWPFCSHGANLLCLALFFPLYPWFLSPSKHAIVSKIHYVYYWLSLPHWASQDLDLYPIDKCWVPGIEQTLNMYWLHKFTNVNFFKGLCKKKKFMQSLTFRKYNFIYKRIQNQDVLLKRE